jgi:hypothetical protein
MVGGRMRRGKRGGAGVGVKAAEKRAELKKAGRVYPTESFAPGAKLGRGK